jgi:hypothetical protein
LENQVIMHSSVFQKSLFFFFVFSLAAQVKGQVAFYDDSNTEVYDFLEEMASLKVIQLNNAVLPLTRKSIYELLEQVNNQPDKLNLRQQKDLKFYQQEFVKDGNQYQGLDYIGKGLKKGSVFPLKERVKRHDLFHYKDSLFSITVNSRFGGEGSWTSGELYYNRYVGATIFGNVSKYFSFYADIRDYSESVQLRRERFLNQNIGANYKAGTDYSEMRGGMFASVKWGYIGLVKDHLKWGTAYNGQNIYSGRTPSFPMIKLHLEPVKWFSFDYIHGWLVSDVLDSAATYQTGSTQREIMRSKFIAANMFTVRPVKGLHFSFGNSVVYSDRFNPVYLIPFLFYKSVDHTLNSTGPGSNSRGQNSQMFVNVVSRNIRYLQLYASAFVDEVRLSTMFNSSKARNHVSWKVGARFTAPKSINASFIFEYTRTNPYTYQHFVSTTTFESNSFGLGHYLRNNAEEFYFAIHYKPISRLFVKTEFMLARKGETYAYTIGSDGEGAKHIANEKLRRYQGNLSVGYQFAHDLKVQMSYQYFKETGEYAYRFVPRVYSSGPHTLSLKIMVGI